MAAFPQGPWSAPLSGTGVEHTIIAGVDALCFLLALAFLATRFSQEPNWKFESRVTGVFLVAGVVFGGFGAMSVTAPYAGLAERLSIGTFLVWSEWVAIALNRRFTETAPAVAPSGGAAAVAS